MKFRDFPKISRFLLNFQDLSFIFMIFPEFQEFS